METRVRTILVADDNVDVRESLAFLLESLGLRPLCAKDGTDAVDLAQQHLPDLAILDLGMPRMDGWEACRRIRAMPGGREIPIVALTGWHSQAHRDRSRDVGFDAHWTKPLDPRALMAFLDQAAQA